MLSVSGQTYFNQGTSSDTRTVGAGGPSPSSHPAIVKVGKGGCVPRGWFKVHQGLGAVAREVAEGYAPLQLRGPGHLIQQDVTALTDMLLEEVVPTLEARLEQAERDVVELRGRLFAMQHLDAEANVWRTIKRVAELVGVPCPAGTVVQIRIGDLGLLAGVSREAVRLALAHLFEAGRISRAQSRIILLGHQHQPTPEADRAAV